MKLAVQPRDIAGPKAALLRGQGIIPAELYGRGTANVHLSVEAKTFRKVFAEAGENTVITLSWGKEQRPALVHDVQRDYLTDEIVHVDFHQIRMDEKIRARIPIEFVGEAPAVKAHGGILNRAMDEAEVEALPGDLPHRLTVDLSALAELEETLYVSDIPVPKGVKLLVDPTTPVVSISAPVEEEVAPPAPVDVSQVKVETEEKKAEREKEKTAEEA